MVNFAGINVSDGGNFGKAPLNTFNASKALAPENFQGIGNLFQAVADAEPDVSFNAPQRQVNVYSNEQQVAAPIPTVEGEG